MKLIYITNTRIPSEKANSYQSMQMCSSFSKYFDEVELWTGRGKNTKELSEIKDVFGYYNIEKSFLIRKFFQFDSRILVNLSEFVWANLKGLVFSVNVCLHLIKYKNNPEVIIFTRVWYVLYIYLFLKRLNLVNNKIFYESHKFSNFLIKVMLKSDGLIVLNNYLKTLYEKHSFNNLCVAHDGVNLGEYEHISNYEFNSNLNEYQIVYTGSFSLDKGINTMVDCLRYLPDNIKFLFIGGSEPYLSNFKIYVKKCNVNHRVKIIPHMRKKRLLEYVDRADVLVLPNSRKDKINLYTSPIKLFEYMASKRPIVASDLSSIKEVLIDQENAILFESDNPKDLASKILFVLKNDCSKIVKRALADVDNYTWSIRAKNITKFIASSKHKS